MFVEKMLVAEAIITANPDPKVTWYKGATAIKDTSENEFSYDAATKSYRLIIYKVCFFKLF